MLPFSEATLKKFRVDKFSDAQLSTMDYGLKTTGPPYLLFSTNLFLQRSMN